VVDVTFSLPSVGATGVIERTAFLPTDAVGLPMGPIDTTPGAPSPSHVGTWADAHRTPCNREAGLDEVCVPGGAYWMGNPHSIDTGLGDQANRSRLVVVSPFFLQRTEVTVAAYRLDASKSVLPWTGSTKGDQTNDYCTFTSTPDANEDKPVNCIYWADARNYCRARGGDLPTEAQIEYVAGGLVSHRFVWGEEAPTCSDAVYGRAGWGLFDNLISPCKTSTPPGGPLPVGFRVSPPRRDRLWTGTGTIFDLIGNVGEWARDEFQEQVGPCWSKGGVFRDPLCQTGVGVHTARGGDWRTVGSLILASGRYGVDAKTASVVVGFRCARSGL
jgi:formylglycine-generating enzyme required for sulfatase activity